MINVLDFIVKCFYIYLRSKGEDGKYAALIPVTFILSSLLSLVVTLIISILFKEELSFLQGALVMIGAFVSGYVFIIRKLGRMYIEKGRTLEFNGVKFYYYFLSPIIFLSSFLFMILSLMALGVGTL